MVLLQTKRQGQHVQRVLQPQKLFQRTFANALDPLPQQHILDRIRSEMKPGEDLRADKAQVIYVRRSVLCFGHAGLIADGAKFHALLPENVCSTMRSEIRVPYKILDA